jgi:HPt (histidine-containing phosphotransfer) domain-containing protein
MITAKEASVDVDLDELALDEMCDGDQEFERELLDTFLACHESAMVELDQAVEDHDFEALKKVAHFTKGGARSVGAPRLAYLAESLEAAASRADFSESAELVQQAHAAYCRLKTIIENRAKN